ncbi:hypothetical protein MKZ38_000493 [Zalerion maritima]|uniref:Uncharacterized protein n=1 Tax=Zalerion maritima TaxID=339359 RepID=A0AAD5WS22_9PEZI|nr:hypothetical protein MKZ38_000493 [Zalerion maritima]
MADLRQPGPPVLCLPVFSRAWAEGHDICGRLPWDLTCLPWFWITGLSDRSPFREVSYRHAWVHRRQYAVITNSSPRAPSYGLAWGDTKVHGHWIDLDIGLDIGQTLSSATPRMVQAGHFDAGPSRQKGPMLSSPRQAGTISHRRYDHSPEILCGRERFEPLGKAGEEDLGSMALEHDKILNYF